MYRGQTVGVVVPAYDEAGRVGRVLRSIPAFVDRVYAVDDRSTDETWTEICEVAADAGPPPTGEATDRSSVTEGPGTARRVTRCSHAIEGGPSEERADAGWNGGLTDDERSGSDERRGRGGRWESVLHARTTDVRPDGRFVPIRHAENRGAGGAIKTGYLAALADGVDVAATVDGDGQMDPGLLPRVLDPVVGGDADYAKGNRFGAAGSFSEMPPVRLVGNVLLTGLTRLVSGYWSLSDPQNGYAAISTDTLADIGVESLFEYYGYCNEVLVRLRVADATVRDVALPARYGDEQSHIDYATFVPKVSGMLLRNLLWRLAVTYLGEDDEMGGCSAGRHRRHSPVETDGSGAAGTTVSSNAARASVRERRRSTTVTRSAGPGLRRALDRVWPLGSRVIEGWLGR